MNQTNLPAPEQQPEVRVEKSVTLSAIGEQAMEVFTLTLGGETIELLPLRNWNQLDHYKWTVRGKLPAEPAGLEIALDQVRITGETVSIKDPAGCEKLERLFNDWLRLERETLELARKKTRLQPTQAAPERPQPDSWALHFRVEVDKRGQVHVHCAQGRETVASIGLTTAGFKSLYQQGFMRKPRTLQTGALHDWVELDGELCSFEKGRNDAARLEQLLNQRYLPSAQTGRGKEVVIFLNAASPTGFDIQLPIKVGGVPQNERHHLDRESLELLQDAARCGLLNEKIIVRLTPPNLVFKRKTQDGGEQYLDPCPENTVSLTDDAGRPKTIQLSQPLNLLRVSAPELTAVFNHPAVNRHTSATPAPAPAGQPQLAPPNRTSQAQPQPAVPLILRQEPSSDATKAAFGLSEPKRITPTAESAPRLALAESAPLPVAPAKPLPNLWLKEILKKPGHRHDWFACLAYSEMAQRFGNSSEGRFGPGACWFISFGASRDIADPAFKGVFLTEKGGLGFLNQGEMARFYDEVAFIGSKESVVEGVHVKLAALGLDAHERVLFILSDDYRAKFGVPEATLTEAINRLSEHGAVIMSATETLASREPLEVIWTVPAEQPDPNNPQVLESIRPR